MSTSSLLFLQYFFLLASLGLPEVYQSDKNTRYIECGGKPCFEGEVGPDDLPSPLPV